MATTNVELANVALGFIGHKRPISDFTDNTVEAQQVSIYFEHTKSLVTARHDWGFARRIVALAEHATATDDRWDFVYVAPTGMAAPRYIWNGANRNPTADDAVVFENFDVGTAANPDRVILTDLEDAQLVYTTSLLPIASYSPHAQDAIAWRLAAYLCAPLKVDPKLAIGILSEASRSLATAMALDFNTAQRDQPQDAEAVRVR